MDEKELQAIKQRFHIIGNATALNRAIEIATQVAGTDLSVLITGESGVGKESFPKIIHQFGPRKHEKYIAVNCGAIPEGTIDSELFGHEKGSFTGALTERKGYFEVADGGTIFLDEVGELPLSTQARLLRVLEVGEFIKVGSSNVQKTDVRVVAATNLNIPKAIQDGKFREDLYYRLNAVQISVPALRNRKSDIPLLFRKFASDFAEKYRMPTIFLTPEAQEEVVNYYWQGNIRQLKNIVEQISIIEEKREINSECLQHYLPKDTSGQLPSLMPSSKSNEKSFSNEREILYQVLFDMKKDIDDLKKMVHQYQQTPTSSVKKEEQEKAYLPSIYENKATVKPEKHLQEVEIEDAQEYEENSFSVNEMEKNLIKKALDKHSGKRKLAALDLKISERTLYRKIKEYDLDA
ncbi:MAG: sigma-54-dependent Fis family transcriptional regulator [Paludibacteraceae bacterium]|nr:sigma-54-dependent Fis family transcriptional regulator [Paludibacteraceae bacterium]MBP6284435.1 sigma-54-dependent Fis family transcriptional regulator [Paludibacteraceae bacterium]